MWQQVRSANIHCALLTTQTLLLDSPPPLPTPPLTFKASYLIKKVLKKSKKLPPHSRVWRRRAEELCPQGKVQKPSSE